MLVGLEWLTVLAATLFASWALYISVVEHPARSRAGAPGAQMQFRESYRRAAPFQASAAAVSGGAGIASSLLGNDARWAVGGVIVALAIPFTLVVIKPTNRILLGPDVDAARARELLERWGRLHWTRTGLGLVGVGVLASRLALR